MTEMDALPDLDINFPIMPKVVEIPIVEKIIEKMIEKSNKEEQVYDEKTDSYNIPKSICIKKQKLSVPWYQPEQDFIIQRHDIDPDEMVKFDAFIDANIPNEVPVRAEALKFIENVLLSKTNIFKSKIFYDDFQGKHNKLRFVISFSF